MILSNYEESIDRIFELLDIAGITSSDFKIDHIGYQAESKEDYDEHVEEVRTYTSMVSENLVGGRRVGIFKLNSPIKYKGNHVEVIEIFEPKEGQVVNSAWEHIELLSDKTLEEVMQDYPNINWDTSALNREEFPMLILQLGEGLRAKFPRLGVLSEVKRLQ